MDKPHDTRIFERINLQLPVKFVDAKSKCEYTGHTVNISAKGFVMVTASEVKAQTALIMQVDIPDKGGPLTLRGKVVWVKPAEGQLYQVGVDLNRPYLMVTRVIKFTD